MEEKKHRLFVYGSLIKGFDGFENYMQTAEFISEAYAKGELRYSFSDYPAMIVNESNEQYVYGELYFVDDETLNRIRKYEGSDSCLTCYKEEMIKVKSGSNVIYAKSFVVSPLKKYLIKFFTFQVPGNNWKAFIENKRKIPIPKPLLLLVGIVILSSAIWEIFHYLDLEKYLM